MKSLEQYYDDDIQMTCICQILQDMTPEVVAILNHKVHITYELIKPLISKLNGLKYILNIIKPKDFIMLKMMKKAINDLIRGLTYEQESIHNIKLEFKLTKKQKINLELDKKIQYFSNSKHFSSKEEEFNKLFKFIDDVGPKDDGVLIARELSTQFSKRISWTIPSRQLINNCTSFIGVNEVLSVASGQGLVEHLLQLKNVNIHATDAFIDDRNRKCLITPLFCDVEHLDYVKAIKKYKTSKILMINWPQQYSEMARDALRMFKGNKFIYIGEEKTGCTATDGFFDEVKKKWKCIKRFNMPHFDTCDRILDICHFYKRRIVIKKII